MEKEFYREMTKESITRECRKIIDNYMSVYDEYYDTNGNSKDSAFLKDLVDSIIGISAVLEVYVRDKEIHPGYALEKLNFSKSYLESVIRYYEEKLKDMEG